MLIELDGAIGQISYRNGGWCMEVELRQALPRCDISLENGKIIHSDSYKKLGNFELHISKEDATLLTTHDPENPARHLKLLVEVAK